MCARKRDAVPVCEFTNGKEVLRSAVENFYSCPVTMLSSNRNYLILNSCHCMAQLVLILG